MTISRSVLAKILVSLTALWATINMALGVNQFRGGDDTGILYSLFDLSNESTLPMWFTSMVLLASGLVTAVIAKGSMDETAARHWWGLAALFAYLSADEAAEIHELLNSVAPETLSWVDPQVRWVVPVVIALTALTAIYLPFLLRLPPDTRRGLIAAAATFGAGAIGAELLVRWLFASFGAGVWTGLTVIVEESLEQFGAIVFLLTLLRHLERTQPPPTLIIHS